MDTKQPANIPNALSESRCQLDHWRSQQPNKRTRLPKELWQQAVTLAKEHGLNKTARALGLKYYSLKKHLEATATDESKPAEAQHEFLELLPSPIIYLFVFTAVPQCVVRMLMSALRRIRRKSGKRRQRQLSPARHTLDGLAGPGSPEQIDLDRSELEAILEHAKTALSQAEYDKLHAAMEKILDEAEKNKHSSDDAAESEEAEKREKAKGHGRARPLGTNPGPGATQSFSV
jgi:hypothetical protein